VIHNIGQTVTKINPEKLRIVARNPLKMVDAYLREVGGYFTASAVKLFSKSFVIDKEINYTSLVFYIDVTKVYKYCCRKGCVLNGTPCIKLAGIVSCSLVGLFQFRINF
jgi:hypothetical protein